MQYLAHSANDNGKPQPLQEHLQHVACLASQFAEAWGGGEEAYVAGLLHDLGKYGDRFQRRLEGKEKGIDHWSGGAWEAIARHHKLNGVATALAIQGHHIGLQQAEPAVLCNNLNPKTIGVSHPQQLRLSADRHEDLIARFEADGLKWPTAESASVYEGPCAPQAAAMLDVRMLYSALVDADYLDTEAHIRGESYRPPGPRLQPQRDLDTLLTYLDAIARQSTATDHVNAIRADLLRACLRAGEWVPGLFTLTAPTGAGKTLSMLAFALQHAKVHNLRRIVMVIPYLSIIDQTVAEYRKVLQSVVEPEALEYYVLEDHSLAGTREDETQAPDPDEQGNTRRLLSQNWDAPIIVTTSVQFLESLFANRPRPCRKLHRLARSVILFDEVQTLPSRLAVPTLATLSRLAERYRASIVFSTATQPAFTHLHEVVQRYCAAGWQPREIVPSDLRLFERARRTQVKWPQRDAPRTSWDELADRLASASQVLCIVNMKRHAQDLFGRLQQRRVDGLYHLSASMCPAHRRVVLEQVRACLAPDTLRRCILVSTQCVEAGVDVDFPQVYRAWGPLDAIAQAAGRCNRNGRMETGTVHVFLPETEGDWLYPGPEYGQAANVAEHIVGDEADINDPNLYNRYYRFLYDISNLAADDSARKKQGTLLNAVWLQDFVKVAQLYRVIEKNAINVLVPYRGPDGTDGTFDALADEVRAEGLTAAWVRRARNYTISLYRPRQNDAVWTHLEAVRVRGRHAENADDWFIYTQEEHYHPSLGLVPQDRLDLLIA